MTRWSLGCAGYGTLVPRDPRAPTWDAKIVAEVAVVMAEYLIVAGMSGAGRSTAAATLEDLGWFVIDNLPGALIGRVAELGGQRGGDFDRFCFVVGRGGPESLSEIVPAIEELAAPRVAWVRVLFLDAADDVLVRRVLRHALLAPARAEGVLDSIESERRALALCSVSKPTP